MCTYETCDKLTRATHVCSLFAFVSNPHGVAEIKLAHFRAGNDVHLQEIRTVHSPLTPLLCRLERSPVLDVGEADK